MHSGQEKDPFLVCAASSDFRRFWRHLAGKKHSQKKNVKREQMHTSSFTLEERGRMPEIGADRCHFVMQSTPMWYMLTSICQLTTLSGCATAQRHCESPDGVQAPQQAFPPILVVEYVHGPDLPSQFWIKANNFRGLFEFLPHHVATINLAYTEIFP